ncbi:coiled-coil domain-containing protein 190 isoform X1 [Microtus ochrogaster]|uniref:Coiled-coil domain-containing protein 190 isoform X1 n=1 Tax=Microtus ochrogaster TaxID=79684 RepID=A0ABM1U0V6_MICOH|nr:coiled-coil domain-containing protein 190 isoform X1 [Microtus ochrogaster]XP_026635619.1 coiled-coil domain-containing protein 190 isoform X1 [Microtus ochrogaster]
MKRVDRNMARGPLYKQFDSERKSARRAEARLSLSLQRLEVICLYHVKTLAREQRQLQKELQRLQQADIIKKRFSSYAKNGIQKRPRDSLTFSPQTGQRRVATQSKIRVPPTNMTQEAKTKIHGPSLPDTALKAAPRSQDHLQSQRDSTSCYKEEYSGAQEGESAKPLKGTDSNVPAPCHGQEVSINNTEDSPVSSPDGAKGLAPADETRSKNADPKPHEDAGGQNAPCSVECAGSFNGKCTKSTFLELLAKAKEAHYLRHRVPPESERMLSIGEIFGHGDASLPRAGKKL